MKLECAGVAGRMCGRPAVWYVWHKSCGGLYTYACDHHLAVRLNLFSGSYDEVSDVKRIREGDPQP